MQSAFADCVDIGITRLKAIVDGNSAAFSQLQFGLLRQIISWSNSGRNDQHVTVQTGAVSKLHVLNLAVSVNRLGRF